MWNDSLNLKYVGNSERIIWAKITNQGRGIDWNLIACHGSPYLANKQKFWKQVDQRIEESGDPWLLIGNLNEVTEAAKKIGGREIQKKKLYLKDLMQFRGGIDLGFNGSRFTWENKQEGYASIKERIDRAVADYRWMEQYPNASVIHFKREASDHCPILLQTATKGNKNNHPFRFLQAWTTNNSSKDLVFKAWNEDTRGGMHWHRLNRSLKLTSSRFKKWNIDVFGNANIKIWELEMELENLQLQDVEGTQQWQIQEKLKEQRARLELFANKNLENYGLKKGIEIQSSSILVLWLDEEGT